MANYKRMVITTVLIIATNLCYSQSEASKIIPSDITGIILDKDSVPIPLCAVSLAKNNESKIIKTVISDSTGKYQFIKINKDNYVIKVTHINSNEKKSIELKSDQFNNSSIQINAIVLDEKINILTEVKVKAVKPFYERRMDRLIVNVENSAIASGLTVLELLPRLPSIKVEQDGISIKGRKGVLLLIDGKGQYVSQDQVTSLLTNTSTETIEKIEIITTPSAKYDASGSSVINIITKKNKIKSDIHYNAGSLIAPYKEINSIDYYYSNLGSNLNLSTGKLKTNIGFDFFQKQDLNLSSEERTYLDNGSRYQTIRSNNFDNSISYRINLNYDISKKSSLDLLALGSWSYDRIAHSKYQVSYNSLANLQGYTLIGSDNWSNFQNNSISAKYGLAINKNSELNIFYDKNKMKRPVNLDYEEIDQSENNKEITFNNRTYIVDINSLKIDYSKKILNRLLLEIGTKYSYVKSLDNNNGLLLDGDSVKTNFNNYIYKERIVGSYINLKEEKEKISYQLGVRLENTHSDGYSETLQAITSRKYTNLFPSASFQYNISQKKQIGINYNKRIRRPTYSDFNPFNTVYNPLLTLKGNPQLNPGLDNYFELNYQTDKYSISISYDNTNNLRTDLPVNNNNNQIIQNYVTNFRFVKNLALTTSIPTKINNWWTATNSIDVYNTRSLLLDNVSITNFNSFDVSSLNNLTISKKSKIDLGIQYYSASSYGYVKVLPRLNSTIAYRTTLLNNKIGLSANINDIFGTNKLKTKEEYVYQSVNTMALKNNRFFRVRIVYYFKSGKIFSIRNKQSKDNNAEIRF